MSEVPNILEVKPGSMEAEEVDRVQKDYYAMYEGDTLTLEKRKANYFEVTKAYYDLVTDFYEYGWGQSFHFAPCTRRETFEMSIARQEMHIAHSIKMEAGKKYIDTGCGVGGPGRTMATFVRGANIVGVNIDTYQLQRARKHTALAKLADQCTYAECDFMNLPFEENTFNGGYNMESLCHAPDKTKCYTGIYRVLQPGSYFASVEWALTPKYDPTNEEHQEVRRQIEIGNGLPDLGSFADHTDAWKAAGFEIVEARDMADNRDHMIPWYSTLQAAYSIKSFRHTTAGRLLTHSMVTALEYAGLVPKGTVDVHNLLITASNGLSKGGELGIFTPLYFCLVRKN